MSVERVAEIGGSLVLQQICCRTGGWGGGQWRCSGAVEVLRGVMMEWSSVEVMKAYIRLSVTECLQTVVTTLEAHGDLKYHKL